MLRCLFLVGRPFGVGLGLFIILNLLLALKDPGLSANQVWLSVPLGEPWLSFFVSILGIALLVPRRCAEGWLRMLQAGIFLGFLLLALSNVVRYYHKIVSGAITSHAAFPFSLLIVAVLLLEIVRLAAPPPAEARVPGPARRFFGGIAVLLACFVMVVAHIYTFGMTDYSEHVGHAGAAVVLGARVYPDGRLSPALEYRMRTGIDLYHRGIVDYLILSGGIDESGVSEPEMMKRYATSARPPVPPSRIILDEGGSNTYLSAKNCVDIGRRHRFDALVVVSQYFHNARAKLIFERAGIPCFTVPADPTHPLRDDTYYLVREAVAYPYYLLFHQ